MSGGVKEVRTLCSFLGHRQPPWIGLRRPQWIQSLGSGREFKKRCRRQL